jgi:hypothetical protein
MSSSILERVVLPSSRSRSSGSRSNQSSRSNQRNNTPVSVSSVNAPPTIDLTVTPAEVVGEIADLNAKLGQMGQTYEHVNTFMQLSKKRKEIEEHLDESYVDVSNKEFIEASRELGLMYKQAKEGRPPRPSEIASLYSKLGRNLGQYSHSVTANPTTGTTKQSPLTMPELENLVKMVDRVPQVPAKRLKSGTYRSVCVWVPYLTTLLP